MRELERGHPEEIKVAVHPDGQPVMTVFGIHHHPQSFLDELLSFSCLLAVPTSFLILCIWTSSLAVSPLYSVIGPDGRAGVLGQLVGAQVEYKMLMAFVEWVQVVSPIFKSLLFWPGPVGAIICQDGQVKVLIGV